MDKVLSCHAGGWGSNLDKTKEDLSVWKKSNMCFYPLGYPTMCSPSLLMARTYENCRLTCYGETKGRVTWKNPEWLKDSLMLVLALLGLPPQLIVWVCDIGSVSWELVQLQFVFSLSPFWIGRQNKQTAFFLENFETCWGTLNSNSTPAKNKNGYCKPFLGRTPISLKFRFLKNVAPIL